MNVTDAINHVHSLRKTIAMARECAMREAISGALAPTLADDVVEALAAQLRDAEHAAADLIGAGCTLHNGARLTVSIEDRRRVARPRFTYRRSGYQPPAHGQHNGHAFNGRA